VVVEPDRAERTVDVTDVRLVEHRGTGAVIHLELNSSHWNSPLSRFHSSGIEAHACAAQDRRRRPGEVFRLSGVPRRGRRLTAARLTAGRRSNDGRGSG
jgi:hypothetical protein